MQCPFAATTATSGVGTATSGVETATSGVEVAQGASSGVGLSMPKVLRRNLGRWASGFEGEAWR